MLDWTLARTEPTGATWLVMAGADWTRAGGSLLYDALTRPPDVAPGITCEDGIVLVNAIGNGCDTDEGC